MAEAFIDGMSFSTEQKDRLKKLGNENMLNLRAITQMIGDQLKSLGFPIGAIKELKTKAESNRIATPTAIPASSGNSTPLISSSPCSSKSPVTDQLTLEELREAVGHLDTKANDTERKHMNHFVCDKLADVSSMRKIFDVIRRNRCILDVVLLGVVVVVVI